VVKTVFIPCWVCENMKHRTNEEGIVELYCSVWDKIGKDSYITDDYTSDYDDHSENCGYFEWDGNSEKIVRGLSDLWKRVMDIEDRIMDIEYSDIKIMRVPRHK
jgi:hypothetical protein